MNTRICFRLFILVALSFHSVTADAAGEMTTLELAKMFDAAKPRHDVEVATVKDSQGRTVRVTIPVKDGDSLFKTSPSELRKASMQYRRQMEASCAGGRGAVAKFSRDFLPESMKFYSAIGMSAGHQAQEDPAYMQHFVTSSFLTLQGHASFAGFLVGSRTFASLAAMAGKTYDPCALLKKYPKGLPVMAPTRAQKLFAPIWGQMGMVAGMMASTAVDAMFDPNIQMCAALQIGKISERDQLKAEEACDTAYEDWVMNGGKLRDMTPEFASMITTGLGLAAPAYAKVAADAGFKRLSRDAQLRLLGMAGGMTLQFAVNKADNTILYRGATLVMGMGKVVQIPGVRLAFEVGNLWLFLKGNEFLKPYFVVPWNTYWQDNDIEATRNSVKMMIDLNQKANWQPNTALTPQVCYNEMGHGERQQIPCANSGHWDTDSIALWGRQEKKWRDFIMLDAMSAASNWQNYVLQFANVYTSAKNVYEDLLKRVDFQRTPNHQQVFEPFYSMDLFRGTPIDPDGWDGSICNLGAKNTKQFTNAILLLNQRLANPVGSASFFAGARYDTDTLFKIRNGIAALDCTKQPKLTDDQRLASYQDAVNLLWQQLVTGPHISYGATVDDPDFISKAGDNTYMQVYYVLGGPEPQWEGGTYVRALDTHTDFVNQDYKSLKPSHLGMVRTSHMTDYLLASMVCGPEATPTAAQKLTAANQSRMSWWERARTMMKGDFQAPNPYTEKDMIAVEKYYEQSVVQGPSLANLGGLLKSDLTIFGTIAMWRADFRPPRIVLDLPFNPCNDTGADAKYISKRVGKADGSREAYTMDPYFTEWTINKKTYKGMQALVREFARTDLTSTSGFANWWSTNVESHVQRVVDIYRAEFVDLINKKYVPVLLNPKRALNGRAMGLTNAVIDSANSTMDMIVPLVKFGPNADQLETEMNHLRRQFIMRLRVQLMLSGPTSTMRQGIQSMITTQMPEQWTGAPPAVPYLAGPGFGEGQIPTFVGKDAVYAKVHDAYEKNGVQLGLTIKRMAELVIAQSKTLAPERMANFQGVAKALFENLSGLVTEIDAYYGVVAAIRSPIVETKAQK